MDPITACLLMSFVIMKMFKVAKVDSQYAKAGMAPPSARLVEKWLDSRKARGLAPADATVKPYGSRDYAKQRWSAIWEDLGDKHREARAAAKKAKAEGRPVPKGTSWKDRILAAWRWEIPGRPRPAAPTPPPAAAPEVTATPPADLGMRIACPDCGQTLTDRDGTWTHPSSSGCPAAPALSGDGAAPDADAGAVEAAEPAPDRMEQPIDPTEGEPMTAPTQTPTQSGEVVGLTSAINYAAAVAAAHEAHTAAGGEQYRASLGEAEVGPDTIQSAAAAQEASQIAAAAWRTHEAKLREQLAAKEATTAETGKKQFLLAE